MSFMTGLRASTSRSLIMDLPTISTPARRWITTASSLQEVEKEIEAMQKKQESAKQKQQSQMAKAESKMRTQAQLNLDMQKLGFMQVEAHCNQPKHLWAALNPMNFFEWRRPEKLPQLTLPLWRAGVGRGTVRFFQEYFMRYRDTVNNLQEVGDMTSAAERAGLPLLKRTALSIFGGLTDNFRPVSREALDIYTSYYRAQASEDFETIDATSIKDMRSTARGIAQSLKVVDWGYTKEPALPQIAYVRKLIIDQDKNINLFQMCCSFDTEQFITTRERDSEKKLQKVTRLRRVQENILFQKISPDGLKQGWKIAGRPRTTPPLVTLRGKEQEEMQAYMAKVESGVAKMMGMSP